jgi:DNA helicase-2/ATP-dependent DNA helicase PcrA
MPSESSLFHSTPKNSYDHFLGVDEWGESRPAGRKLFSDNNRPGQSSKDRPFNQPVSHYTSPTSNSTGKHLVKLNSTASASSLAASSGSASGNKTVEFNGQNIHVGQNILHERFGKGTVTEVDGTGSNCTMSVDFENSGNKRLLLKFAKFTLID